MFSPLLSLPPRLTTFFVCPSGLLYRQLIYRLTSYQIVAWKCNFPAVVENYDIPTDRPINQPTRRTWGFIHREVTLPLRDIGKIRNMEYQARRSHVFIFGDHYIVLIISRSVHQSALSLHLRHLFGSAAGTGAYSGGGQRGHVPPPYFWERSLTLHW